MSRLVNFCLLKFSARSIRFQVLWSVNLILGVAIIGLLVFQYQREMVAEAKERNARLNEEAIAIHVAVSHLAHEHQSAAVQAYIDTICNRMHESSSPCQHIVVKLDGKVLQSRKHANEGTEMLSVIAEAAIAPDHKSSKLDKVIVVGSQARDGISVFVSENLDDARRSIRRHVLLQIGELGLLGIVAAGVVNVVLLRIVDRPLTQMVETVDRISGGEFGVSSEVSTCLELKHLSAAIDSMSLKLQENENERRQQMLKAQRIQQHLLPGRVQIPGIQTAHIFKPADIVAGDYYDFLPLSDGSWLICLADVTGHGVPAAMGAAMLKSLLLVAIEEPPFDLVHIIQQVNLRFAKTVMPGNFASMFLARWTPDNQSFAWVSAGHETGILLEDHIEKRGLHSTGLLLGIDLEATWEQHQIELKENQRILLFSDGATETHSPAGDLFGRSRLLDCFARYQDQSIAIVLERICDDLGGFRNKKSMTDDLTLVGLDFSKAI